MVEELERPGENRDRKGTEANGGGGDWDGDGDGDGTGLLFGETVNRVS